jgi:hypothetical protein
LNKLETQASYFNIIKIIYDKSIANIILYGKKLKPFPLKSRTGPECSLCTLLQQSAQMLSQSNKARERKGYKKKRSQTIPVYMI